MSNNLPNNATDQNPLGVGATAARSQPLRERRLKMPNSQPNALSPQLVWYSLVRWWKIALPIGLACAAAAAAAVWVTFQQEYRASVWIQIFENPQYLVFGERNGPATSELFVATQMQLLSSPMVMYGTDDIGPEGVVDELLNGKLEGWSGSDVPDLPSEEGRDRAYLGDWISKGVSVTRVGKTSELYTVSFTSISPRFAKAVANAVSRNYLALLANQVKTRNTEIIELLEKANTNRIADLTVDRKALDVFGQRAAGSPWDPGQARGGIAGPGNPGGFAGQPDHRRSGSGIAEGRGADAPGRALGPGNGPGNRVRRSGRRPLASQRPRRKPRNSRG